MFLIKKQKKHLIGCWRNQEMLSRVGYIIITNWALIIITYPFLVCQSANQTKIHFYCHIWRKGDVIYDI